MYAHKESNTQETIKLSIFISSPGDLPSTRQRAREVMYSMSGMSIEGLKVIFQPMLYEDHTPAMVGEAPQQAVDYFLGTADQMDIYVGMFGSRMGSPVVVKGRRIPSGTRYEFDTAYNSYRFKKRPLMLLYRCLRPQSIDCDEAQRAEVAEFFESFRGDHPQYRGLPKKFFEDDEFEVIFRADLHEMAKRVICEKHVTKPDRETRDFTRLVESVRDWLASFEDMFGKDLKDHEERERDRLFKIQLLALPDPYNPAKPVSRALLPTRDQSMLDLFNKQSKGRLLVVGERGTGKTFAMLKLMQDLADRAFLIPGEPVPVFFNLSSWSETYHDNARPSSLLQRGINFFCPKPRSSATINDWLVEQMVRNYSIERGAAQALLVQTSKMVICLDGLDELCADKARDKETNGQASRDLRDACVEAINATAESSARKILLCCREDTYGELTCKPRLGIPLQTQLLTTEQVFADLQRLPNLQGLQKAMKQSSELSGRARVALFLGMMRVAYQDVNDTDILEASALPVLEWEKDLLDRYIGRCLEHATPAALKEPNSENLIPNCLTWMAKQTDNDFLLDDLQPTFLFTNSSHKGESLLKQYITMSTFWLALPLMILETLPTGLSLAIEWTNRQGWHEGLVHCLKMWGASTVILLPLYWAAFKARTWVGFGTFFGTAWAMDHFVYEYLSAPEATFDAGGSWEGAVHLFTMTLPSACIFFMLVGIQFHKRLNRAGLQSYDILPIEPLSWCWFDKRSYWRGGWLGFVVGPLITLLLWSSHPTRAMAVGLVVTSLVTVFSGMAGTGIARMAVQPNQGIARSLRHASFMTVLFVLLGIPCLGICYGVGIWMDDKAKHKLDALEHGIEQGLVNATLGGSLLFAFYVFGGIPVIRQFCLGRILHGQGMLPAWRWRWISLWRYVPPWNATVEFLDDLVRYKLLRRSAGGYMFRHDLLREYYRSLGDKEGK